MKDRMTRREALKSVGVLTVGSAALGLAGAGALSLGRPSSANAQIPHHAFLEGYVTNSDLGLTILVQAVAPSVPVVAAANPPATLASPGRGFDVDLGEAVVGNNSDKNKGRLPGRCLLSITKGAYNGFPPVNSGGVDAIRLEGVVTDAGDPAFIGVPVKVHGSSAAAINNVHPICLIKFDFGGFLFTGLGLAFVNL